MKKIIAIILLISTPFFLLGQKIKGTTTILEKYKNESSIKVESLEVDYDRKGRITKETYTDIDNKQRQQKIINYKYKGKKKTYSNTLYASLKLEKPVWSYQEISIKKKVNKRDYIERTIRKKISKQPFYYISDGLENTNDASIEEMGSGIPLDQTIFNVSPQIIDNEELNSITILKNFTHKESNIVKAKFGYYRDPKVPGTFNLFIGWIYEKQHDDSMKISFIVFSGQPSKYNIEYSQILDKKGLVIKERGLTYTYEYDRHGNWTIKTSIYKGKPLRRYTRSIRYY